MHAALTQDQRIQAIATAMLRASSRDPEKWRFTVIGQLHPRLDGRLTLARGELVVTSAITSDESWYAFTTRRVVSLFEGRLASIKPMEGLEAEFGDFKSFGGFSVNTATMKTPSGQKLLFEYETGLPSMAPINAAKYWNLKHPILHKLLTPDVVAEYLKSRQSPA